MSAQHTARHASHEGRTDLITTTEAAAILGRHPSRVQQLIQSGVIRKDVDAFKIAGEWRIKPETLERAEVQRRPTGRPRTPGARVRTDRINNNLVFKTAEDRAGRSPLEANDRYAVQNLVKEAIAASNRQLTEAEMVEAGLPAVYGKNWPRDLALQVVELIIFGQKG